MARKWRWRVIKHKRYLDSDKFIVAGEIKAPTLKAARSQALNDSTKTQGWHKGRCRVAVNPHGFTALTEPCVRLSPHTAP